MSRLFAWSDLHVDYPENYQLIADLSDADYANDTILVAGDLSSDPKKLVGCLSQLKRKFRDVSYVPGNHDLWVSTRDTLTSLDKLFELHAACRAAGIRVEPFETRVHNQPLIVAPLLSWYLKPEEGAGSLFLEKPGEDPTLRMWSDNYRIKWPNFPGEQPAALHLLALNTPPKKTTTTTKLPIVTFSHFLPRVELVFKDWNQYVTGGHVSGNDANPEFNFTRVAGCRQLDQLLRGYGSTTHVYGHQHRNRDRCIDGVRYLSHCLGYPPEWRDQHTRPARHRPLEIPLPAPMGS